jgi:hypothetical protein
MRKVHEIECAELGLKIKNLESQINRKVETQEKLDGLVARLKVKCERL